MLDDPKATGEAPKGEFCRACGASIPKRLGEGACEKCDPEGVKVHVASLRGKVIGIVGSRRRNTVDDFHKVAACFRKLYEPGDRIVSGGCPEGGDRFAEIIALEIGYPGKFILTQLWVTPIAERHRLLRSCPFILHRAEWARYGKAAGFKRNTLIAQDADVLIACVAADRTGGTEDTIAKFLRKGKTMEDVYLC